MSTKKELEEQIEYQKKSLNKFNEMYDNALNDIVKLREENERLKKEIHFGNEQDKIIEKITNGILELNDHRANRINYLIDLLKKGRESNA